MRRGRQAEVDGSQVAAGSCGTHASAGMRLSLPRELDACVVPGAPTPCRRTSEDSTHRCLCRAPMGHIGTLLGPTAAAAAAAARRQSCCYWPAALHRPAALHWLSGTVRQRVAVGGKARAAYRVGLHTAWAFLGSLRCLVRLTGMRWLAQANEWAQSHPLSAAALSSC